MLTIVSVALLLLVSIYNLIELNKRRMGASEFFAWQSGILIFTLVLSFPRTAQTLASFFGFELLSNMILSSLILVLLFIIRLLSRELNNLKSQIEELVRIIALDDKKNDER